MRDAGHSEPALDATRTATPGAPAGSFPGTLATAAARLPTGRGTIDGTRQAERTRHERAPPTG